MANQPIAIVSGANRGIGLEVCRQLAEQGYVVVLGSRDAAKGEKAAAQLHVSRGTVVARQLDVTDLSSIEALRMWVEAEYGRLDVLINNAAINYDTWHRAVNADLNEVRDTLETNIFGAWQMTQAFVPLLQKSQHPRIVNVSSQSGSLASMGGGTPGYSLSKAGLNALTRMLAAELRGSRILVNAVCPGWVATDMGGSGGRPVAQGAVSILWAVTLPDNGPSGGFYRDGKPVAW